MTEGNGDHSRDDFTPQPRRPAVSWGVKIRKKLKPMAPFLGTFRPLVGQSCHQCTPESVGRQLLKNAPLLGFRNLLSVKETHTRYRGWLVRRVCCVLFICGRKVDSGPAGDRLLRICSTDRVKRVLTPQTVAEECGEDTRGILALAEASQSPSLIRSEHPHEIIKNSIQHNAYGFKKRAICFSLSFSIFTPRMSVYLQSDSVSEQASFGIILLFYPFKDCNVLLVSSLVVALALGSLSATPTIQVTF